MRQAQRFAYRVGVPEVFLRHRFRDQNRIRMRQRRRLVTTDQLEIEHVEQRRVRKEETTLGKPQRLSIFRFVRQRDTRSLEIEEAGGGLDVIRIIGNQRLRHRKRHARRLFGALDELGDSVDAIRVGMITVIRELIPNVEQNQNEAGDPNRQSETLIAEYPRCLRRFRTAILR